MVYSFNPQDSVNIDLLKNTLQSMGVPGSIMLLDTSGVHTTTEEQKHLVSYHNFIYIISITLPASGISSSSPSSTRTSKYWEAPTLVNSR